MESAGDVSVFALGGDALPVFWGDNTVPGGDGREVGRGGVHSSPGVLCCGRGGEVGDAGDLPVSVFCGDAQPVFSIKTYVVSFTWGEHGV